MYSAQTIEAVNLLAKLVELKSKEAYKVTFNADTPIGTVFDIINKAWMPMFDINSLKRLIKQEEFNLQFPSEYIKPKFHDDF